MTLSGTTALVFAASLLFTPVPTDIGSFGASTISDAPVEMARQRRYPKCTKVKRAPCEMLKPEPGETGFV